MSFIISEKQHLATSTRRFPYKPFESSPANCQRFPMEIHFGHPLYTSLISIFAVKCIAQPTVFPVIPDGCITILFYGKEDQMQGRLCGMIDEIKKIELQPEELLLALRFSPSETASFLHENAIDLANKTYDAKTYLKNGDQIIAAACKELDVTDKAMLLSKLLRLRMQDDHSNYLIHFCIERIFENRGNIKISQLGRETGYSERHLGKMFEKYVGVSPKMYCEIMRLQFSLNMMLNGSNREPLLTLALDCGFFDHTHMNRCYKRFLHCSSGALKKQGLDCLDYSRIDPYIN